MRNALGNGSDSVFPIGTIRIRTRHKRRAEQRAFIKIAEPNAWVLNAHHVWESLYGPIPKGMGVHHKDRNKLNDAPENLELKSKAAHLAEHRSEHDKNKRIANFIRARRKLRWSTKSKTKQCGRHPIGCRCPIHFTPPPHPDPAAPRPSSRSAPPAPRSPAGDSFPTGRPISKRPCR